jgi:hypothetical protein
MPAALTVSWSAGTPFRRVRWASSTTRTARAFMLRILLRARGCRPTTIVLHSISEGVADERVGTFRLENTQNDDLPIKNSVHRTTLPDFSACSSRVICLFCSDNSNRFVDPICTRARPIRLLPGSTRRTPSSIYSVGSRVL